MATDCDGATLLGALEAAGAALEHHAEAINALNVFPVPDGDTGKNMTLTMQAALEAARAAGTGDAGVLATKLARGAMMGSRGNSGVILSQILRGFARGLGTAESFGGRELAAGLREAATTAYRAVQQPVEGTMLTVIRVAAEGAERAVRANDDTPGGVGVLAVLDAALTAAREALARTPTLLPRLREAGVVDAGGQGVVTLLEGAARYARGESVADVADLVAPLATTLGGRMADFMEEHEDDEVGYCTNLLILSRHGEELDFPLVRDRILALGESGVVIGDEELVKIHIHTEHPGAVLEEAVRWGELSQIRIDNMAAQVRDVAEAVGVGASAPARTAEAREPVPMAAGPSPRPPAPLVPDLPPPTGPQVVAVASGAGLVEVLRGLGAARIVAGGQTMNPSTEELLRAVEATPGDEVILLPNNGNVILTAEQVAELTPKRVAVVPTRSLPQGITALSALNFEDDLDDNVAAMTAALRGVCSGEVTRAVRTVTIDGVSVAEGQTIGLIDDKLYCSGEGIEPVMLTLLRGMGAGEAELITLYRGEGVDEASGEAMVESLQSHFPDAAFELVDGGQPHYDYLVSVE